MRKDLKPIAKGFRVSAKTLNVYDVNGYRFHTHSYTQNQPNKKTINSGVLCNGEDGVHYYVRVEEIFQLDYGSDIKHHPVIFK
jgi:hypothetical protein